MTDRNSIIGKVDWPILLMYFALVVIGWLSIYSAGMSEGHHAIYDMTQFCGKQMMWIGIAMAAGFVILILDAKLFDAFSFWIYAVVVFLLIVVLVYGKATNGATSWIDFGGFKLQPSEFAKLGTALAVASLLGKQDTDLQQRKTRLKVYALILAPAALVLLQHDAGSALVFASFIFVLYREGMPGAGAVMLLAAGALAVFVLTLVWSVKVMCIVLGVLFALTLLYYLLNKKKGLWRMVAVYAFLIALVFSVDYAFYHILEEHQRTRFEILLKLKDDPQGDGYNLHQSKIAIGSGGFWGKGFLNGTQTKYDFVPEQHTDFIFCTIGEEGGFKGSFVVILLYVGLLVRIIKVAERQRLAFSRIYGYSIAGILFVHVAVNIGMTIGLVPVVGIPLPFLSYGGSSLLAFTVMLAIFLKQDANRLNILS
ncbi:MAG: rod shape-determining protein RodA [Bacteroidales bacterium]|nr:rod shape-determining protein RodA [Bacteroidales bacterium]